MMLKDTIKQYFDGKPFPINKMTLDYSSKNEHLHLTEYKTTYFQNFKFTSQGNPQSKLSICHLPEHIVLINYVIKNVF